MKLISIILTVCMALAANAQDNDAAIRQTIDRLFEGMRKADTALIRSAFAPGAILQTIVKTNGETHVVSQSLDSFLLQVAMPHTEIYDERITFETVKADDALAIAWTPYKFYIGEKFSHCGVNSFQLTRSGREWKIQYLIDTRRKQPCD